MSEQDVRFLRAEIDRLSKMVKLQGEEIRITRERDEALVKALAGYDRFITMMHELAGENGYKSGIALAQQRCRVELDRIDTVMSQVRVAVGGSNG